eukprot:g7561.t1
MLASDREVLAAFRVRQTSDLLAKEIDYMLNEINTIATQASLLAGFVFVALTMQGSTVNGNPYFGKGGGQYTNNAGTTQGLWNEKRQGLDLGDPAGAWDYNHYTMTIDLAVSEILFTLVLGGGLVFQLLCIFCSTFIAMWGPRRALTAEEAEMEETLIKIRRWRARAIQYFLLGNYAFLMGPVVIGWGYWQGPSALATTAVCVYGSYALWVMEARMRRAFRAPRIFNKYDPKSEPLLADLMSHEAMRRDLAERSRSGISGAELSLRQRSGLGSLQQLGRQAAHEALYEGVREGIADDGACTACGADRKSYTCLSQTKWLFIAGGFAVLAIGTATWWGDLHCCCDMDWCGNWNVPCGAIDDYDPGATWMYKETRPCSQIMGYVAIPILAAVGTVVGILGLMKCCCFGRPKHAASYRALQRPSSEGAQQLSNVGAPRGGYRPPQQATT